MAISDAKVPGLEQLARLLVQTEYYEIFCVANIIVASGCFFYFFRHPLRLGRFYRRGTSRFKIQFRDTYCVAGTNLLCLGAFKYVSSFFVTFVPGSLPAMFFTLLHLFRGVVYSWYRSDLSAPWPLESLLYVAFTKIAFGALAARAFTSAKYLYESETPLNYLVLLFLLIVAVFQSVVDYRLTKLRENGDRGYRIPTGFPYNLISCPGYLCEILIWALWGAFFQLDIGVVAMWFWLLPNVYGRAEVTHRWYLKTFKAQYPKNRTAIIPYLSLSRVFVGIMGSLEYVG